MSEEQQNETQLISYYNMPTVERAKYAGVAVLSTFGVAEILGAGSMGLVAAGLAGFVVAHFGEEIRDNLVHKLPRNRAERRQGRSGRLFAWLVTGHYPVVQAEEVGEESEEVVVSQEPDAPSAQSDTGEQQTALPQSPTFREMCHLIGPNRLVLCWGVDGPIYGTVEDLLSMAIIGIPGRGKTTALIYYVGMLLASGAEVHVWDPHSSMNELAGIPRLHYTDDLEEMSAGTPALFAELEERRKLWKTSKQVKHPLLLLVDELPVLGQYASKHDKTMVDLLEKFVLEARKWNCYFIGAGQSTDAEILPTRVTENLASRIVFFSSHRRARMAGLDVTEDIKNWLKILKPDSARGKMIFDCARLGGAILGAIPWITIKDLQDFLNVPISAVPAFGNQGNSGNETGNDVEMALEADVEDEFDESFPISGPGVEMGNACSKPEVSDQTLEMIGRMKEKGFQDNEIAAIVRLQGRKYGIYRRCLVYLGYGEGGRK